MNRKIFYLLFLVSSLIFAFTKQANAQIVSSVSIGSIVRTETDIEFTLNAPKPFYVGSNVFVLHIGSASFDRYRQTDIDGKGTLVFIIPANEFHGLKEGANIYLTYGAFWSEETSDEEALDACKESPDRARFLGKLSAEMLHQ